MLTVEILERFPEAAERWQKAFRYVLVDEYQDTNHAQYRLLQLLAGKHRNVFVVGDPDQSIYAFRGADIRNVLEFEHDFAGAQVIPLEQNYRSTNRILSAANSLIANNRERKPKNLWSDLGEGEPVRVVEVEDEHAEARLVAAEIAQLGKGYAGSELAVFYRTNAQSRVIEDVLVRQDVPYQVIGGPRFYERAEVKDAVAYLQVIDNPADAVSLTRIANRPRRGWGTRRSRAWRGSRTRRAFPSRRPRARGRGRLLGAPLRAGRQAPRAARRAGGGGRRAPRAGPPRAGPGRVRLPGVPRGERTVEAQGRLENLMELVGVAREYQGTARSRASPTSSRASRSSPTRTSSSTREKARDAHDAPQREGPRVPGRVPRRDGGGRLPARTLDRGGRARGGTPPRLRRSHPGARSGSPSSTPPGGSLWGSRNYNLPSRFLDELPQDEIERDRLRPSSWSGYGSPTVTPREAPTSRSSLDRRRGPPLDARRGLVTRIEPDGVVTVRFADDGAERRLMLEYAPLERG